MNNDFVIGKFVMRTLRGDENLKGTAKISRGVLKGFTLVVFLLSLFVGIIIENIMIGISVFLVSLPFLLVTVIREYIYIKSIELAFTDKRVIGKVGLINTVTIETPLNKVNNISIRKNFLAHLFGYGTIIITSSSMDHVFHYIENPEKFKNSLLDEMDKFNNNVN